MSHFYSIARRSQLSWISRPAIDDLPQFTVWLGNAKQVAPITQIYFRKTCKTQSSYRIPSLSQTVQLSSGGCIYLVGRHQFSRTFLSPSQQAWGVVISQLWHVTEVRKRVKTLERGRKCYLVSHCWNYRAVPESLRTVEGATEAP